MSERLHAQRIVHGWDTVTAGEIKIDDYISVVPASGQGFVVGTVEFIDTTTIVPGEPVRIRFRLDDGTVSYTYRNQGTLGVYRQ